MATTPRLGECISGAILYDETIRQESKDETSFVEILHGAGLIPGIKVDIGAKSLAGHPGEKVTEGLDGLRARLRSTTGWVRASRSGAPCLPLDERIPSRGCIEANAHALYKAPPAHALTEEYYETDPSRDFARSFAIQTVGPLPITFAKRMAVATGAWRWGLRRVVMDYNHWAGFGFLGEILPHAENRVQLADETDRFGLPVAKVTFNLQDNDKKLMEFGKNA